MIQKYTEHDRQKIAAREYRSIRKMIQLILELITILM